MSDVVPLKAVTVPQMPVDEKVVALLRQLLALAEAGEFQGIAYATVETTGAGSYTGTGSGFAGGGIESNIHVALGALQVLNRRLLEFEHDGE